MKNEIRPDITVVVLSYNTKALLSDCLKSLQDNSDGLILQVIVVDNASHDGSARMVGETFPQVVLIENRENLGSAKGTNTGIRRSTAPYVLILNPDTLIKPGALRLMYDFLESKQGVGIVGPKLVGEDGDYQQSCYHFPLLTPKAAALLVLSIIGISGIRSLGLVTNPVGECNGPTEVDWVYTSCALVRHEVFDEIGLLDENIFFAGDDMDLCYRAQIEGWKTAYLPEAEIIHYGNRSGMQVYGDFHSYERAKTRVAGLDYFLSKHFSGMHSVIVRLLTGIGYIVASIMLALKCLIRPADRETRVRFVYFRNITIATLASLLEGRESRARRMTGAPQ